jgi:putative endopeptidase
LREAFFIRSTNLIARSNIHLFRPNSNPSGKQRLSFDYTVKSKKIAIFDLIVFICKKIQKMFKKFRITLLFNAFSMSLFLLLAGFMLFPGDNKQKGVEVSIMDQSIKPSEDLFRFANGTWLKNNPIPASEANWGAFNELQEKNNTLLRTIIEEAARANAPKGSIKQKVGDFYAVAMDTLKLEKEGLKPIEQDLKKIDQAKSTEDVIRIIADFHKYGTGSLFGLYVTQDQKKSDEYIAYLNQGGLGLPDRDYYLKEDDNSKKIREEYIDHIGKIFTLAGKKEMASNAPKIIMAMETDLAKASMTNVELRDDEKQYHKFTYAELNKSYPASRWETYFQAVGIPKIENLIVSQPDFFAKANEMMSSYSLNDWKVYLTWSLLNEAADKLGADLEKQNFKFYGTVLSGTKEMRPRWKRMISATNVALGEAVGQLYVEKAFSPESKKRVNEMVDNLMAAYKERIINLDWMSETTKQKALEKLAAFNRKLGYPDKWRDYTPLTINRESYYSNSVNAQNFRFNRMISKLGKPIDRTEWGLTPQTINAYYSAQKNEIVFPAAIMQPPFFNADADDAVNYGAIGAVIGHEITHGFDDQGSRYDKDGNMLDWWTAEDRKKFDERTKKIVDQFNNYKALDDLNVNGELTLGENIADLGGLTMAYAAYQRSLKGRQRSNIEGFTPEQRFFIGWAQVWRVNYRPESLRRLVLTNVHSPENFRAIGAPSNLTEFYEAFNVKPGDPMHRDENLRAKVW